MKELNFHKLALHKLTRDAKIANIGEAVEFIKDEIGPAFKLAKEWTRKAIQAVRNAEDPNPWRHATDDEIAAVILEKIEEKQRKKKGE